MDSKHKGARAELTASVWLLNNGYEVFKNVSAHGIIDIIARNVETGELLLLDVKTLSPFTNVKGVKYLISGKLSDEQFNAGVRSLNVGDGFCFIEKNRKNCYKFPDEI